MHSNQISENVEPVTKGAAELHMNTESEKKVDELARYRILKEVQEEQVRVEKERVAAATEAKRIEQERIAVEKA